MTQIDANTFGRSVQRISIDPALKKRLQDLGMFDKIEELEIGQAKSSIASQAVPGIVEAHKKVNIPLSKTIFSAGGTIGAGLATVEAKKFEEDTSRRQQELGDVLIKQLKDPSISRERKLFTVREFAKINPSIISQVPELQETLMQSVGKFGVTAFNVGLLLATGGTLTAAGPISRAIASSSGVVNTLGKTQQVTTSTGKVKVVSDLSMNIAGKLLRGSRSFLGGSLFGTALALQSDKEDPKEVAKQAATFGIFNLAAPAVLGQAFKWTAKGSSILSSLVKNKVEKDVAHLTAKLKQSANKADGFLSDGMPPPSETIRATTDRFQLKTLKAFKDLRPAWTDRLAPILDHVKSVQRKYPSLKIIGTAQDAYILARDYAGIDGKFTIGKHDFDKMLSKYEGMEGEVLSYTKGMDLLTRLQRGQKIEKGGTLHTLNKELLAIEKNVQKKFGKEGLEKLQRGVTEYSNFVRDKILKEFVDSGLVNKKIADKWAQENPFYVPHDVLDFAEDVGIRAFVGDGGFNVVQSGIKAAKGSERELVNVYDATMHRLGQAQRLSARNRVAKQVIELGKKDPEAFGFTPLRTTEQVQQRTKQFEVLAELKKQLVTTKKDLKVTNKQDRIILSRIDKTIKEIDTLSEKAIREFVALEMPAEAKAIQTLTTKTDFRPIEKQVAKETKGIKEQALVLNTKTKERLGVINKQITQIQNSLKQAEAKLGIKKTKPLNDITVAAELNSVSREQKKLLKALQDKDAILEAGSTKFVGGAKPKPEVKLELKTEQLGPQKQIDQSIIKSNNDEIEKLKSKIATRESKLADLEVKKFESETTIDGLLNKFNAQRNGIRQVFEEIKRLKDTKVKPADLRNQGLGKISFFDDGILNEWAVPEDLAAAMKNMDAEQITGMMKWFTYPQDILRNFATRFNIAFTISNLPRDLQTAAGINKNGLSGKALKDALNEVSDFDNPTTRAFFEGGGAFGGLIGVEKPSRSILESSNRAKIFNGPSEVGKLVESIGERFENSVRLSVYKNELSKGVAHDLAIFRSRNATVDFAKMGNQMRVLNAFIPFLNARTQGMINVGKAINRDPTQFVRRQFYQSVYPSMLLYGHNRNFESYKNIPAFDKKNNWIFQYGEHDGFDNQGRAIKVPEYVGIKKGEAQQPTANIVERYMSMSDGENPEGVGKFMLSNVFAFSPIGTGSGGPLALPIELSTNINFYTNTSIEPEFQEVVPGGKKFPREDVPSELRATRWTGETAKFISSNLGLHNIGISPARVEFIVGKIFASPGKDVLTFADMTQTGFDRTNIPEGKASTMQKLSKLPLFRSFLGTNAAGEIIALYDKVDRIKEDTIMPREIEKQFQAYTTWTNLKMMNEAGKAKEANETYRSLSKDEKKAIIKIKENETIGRTPAMDVYDRLNSNELKARFLIDILNDIPTAKEKNVLIKQFQASDLISDIIMDGLREAKAKGMLNPPTSE